MYITTPGDEDTEDASDKEGGDDHPFTGYFLPHPAHTWRWRGEGMVSTVSAAKPPLLNWIYVDKDTCEVKYGNKIESTGHVMGPWTCTKVDRRLLFEGWEGFLAVREEDGGWALYFDREDDGLGGREGGKLEVELWRKELRRGWGEREERL